jgi:pyrimidine-nucleoside phosphorylase
MGGRLSGCIIFAGGAMRPVDIIIKKRDGETLSSDEIASFIQGFTKGNIPDYQVSAWAMAVLLQGMNARETTDLTLALADSGDQLDLSDVVPFAVDKHSTGGVGDKTTLVVGPIVAACDVPVGKMSGRGLGFTGGTLDKMESIPGFDVSLTTEKFREQLKEIGIVLSGQTADLAPADGKLYALRDVTGTVPSIPLIASSVMSKKIAGGAQAIVLDVKLGLGAFMTTIEQARALAQCMVEIGEHAGRKVVALISDMNQPLGLAVGNALEVKEALDTLNGDGPADFREHCLEISGHMLLLAQVSDNFTSARKLAETKLQDGAALDKFRQLVKAQGGDIGVIDDPSRLPIAPLQKVVVSTTAGFIQELDAGEIGLAAMALGAGRAKKGDPVDHAVGIVLAHKVGDAVKVGDRLFTVHAQNEQAYREAEARLLACTKIVEHPTEPLPLFYATLA